MTEGRGLEALGSNFVIGSAQGTLGRDPEVIAMPRTKEARAGLPTPLLLAASAAAQRVVCAGAIFDLTKGLQGVSVSKLGEVRDGIDTEAVVGGLLTMC